MLLILPPHWLSGIEQLLTVLDEEAVGAYRPGVKRIILEMMNNLTTWVVT